MRLERLPCERFDQGFIDLVIDLKIRRLRLQRLDLLITLFYGVIAGSIAGPAVVISFLDDLVEVALDL